jgi:hypothetical protein
MNCKTGIWIDGSKAIIVKLNHSIESVIELKSNIETAVHHENGIDKAVFMGKKHITKEKKFEERKKHQTTAFLKNVIETSKNAGELFVFGPGNLKTQLKDFILKDKFLAIKLKAVEKADSMTLEQIIAHVKAFFRNESKSKSL